MGDKGGLIFPDVLLNPPISPFSKGGEDKGVPHPDPLPGGEGERASEFVICRIE